MAVKNKNEKETVTVKAKEGDSIEIKSGEYKGKTGKILGIRDNSVIVDLLTKTKSGETMKTIVNHKNYKIK